MWAFGGSPTWPLHRINDEIDTIGPLLSGFHRPGAVTRCYESATTHLRHRKFSAN